MTIIKSIDKDHNGYVTSTELDDILKILYPGPFDPLARSGGLQNVALKSIIRPYASSANRVLVDYKKFRDFISNGLKNMTK